MGEWIKQSHYGASALDRLERSKVYSTPLVSLIELPDFDDGAQVTIFRCGDG